MVLLPLQDKHLLPSFQQLLLLLLLESSRQLLLLLMESSRQLLLRQRRLRGYQVLLRVVPWMAVLLP
jgi:hypothetical protein